MPTVAVHTTLADGRVHVAYNDGTEATYADRREASIESSLRLWPGTSREWLEKIHRPNRLRSPKI